MNPDVKWLKEQADRLENDNCGIVGIRKVADHLLDDPRFELWSGSSKPFQHHYGSGGLAAHTREVVELCLDNRSEFFTGRGYDIDRVELFFAALFHDAGKMWDYKLGGENDGDWTGTTHKRLIHHISRSGLFWTEAAALDPVINRKCHEPVLHAILSHHGAREHGSPVAPLTRVAWMVYLCDSMSARMYDADTLDVVHRDVGRT